MEILGVVPIEIGAGAILAGVVIAILNGWLAPQRVLKEKNEEIAEWRRAYKLESEARRLSELSNYELIRQGRVFEKMVNSLPQPPYKGGNAASGDTRGGESDE